MGVKLVQGYHLFVFNCLKIYYYFLYFNTFVRFFQMFCMENWKTDRKWGEEISEFPYWSFFFNSFFEHFVWEIERLLELG